VIQNKTGMVNGRAVQKADKVLADRLKSLSPRQSNSQVSDDLRQSVKDLTCDILRK